MMILRLRGRTITDPKERSFYGRCYSTLGASALFILPIFAFYVYYYHSFYTKRYPHYLTLGILALACLGISSLAGYLKTERVDFFAWEFTLPFWAQLLPIVTLFFILSVIFICALSGGAQLSPFAQFLLPMGTLAIVFARKWLNRLSIVLLTGAGYSFLLYYYLEPAEGELPGIGWFHWMCAMIAIAVGALAAWKVPDWQRRTPTGGGSSSPQSQNDHLEGDRDDSAEPTSTPLAG